MRELQVHLSVPWLHPPTIDCWRFSEMNYYQVKEMITVKLRGVDVFCRTSLPGRSGGYPPDPPQIRTCPIKAYGSSDTTLLPCTIHWNSVDTVGELKVSPIFPPSRTSCPASPSLPWVPWVSVPHFHRYYAKATTTCCPFRSLRSSLASRYPVASLWFVSPRKGRVE